MSQGNAAQSKFIPCQSSSKNPPRPSQYLSTYLDHPAALARARPIAAASLARLFGQASPRAGEGPTEHEVGGGKSDFGLSTPDCQPRTDNAAMAPTGFRSTPKAMLHCREWPCQKSPQAA